ncbi:hypothetical protein [Campylobacter insulaenigrae]|uniref:hypothetical protein n=1 Tax=Campylobacter insulaenigrae TaxID=260714 RepID=UPI0021520AD4|nr:hypothetical protein [Campylobacter insulaenigrae]MCR6571165.1 hypothetical protein [Campylobacter insulaenigrae]
MKIINIAILILILGLNLNAKVVTSVSTKTSVGEGTGLTREEAINNAIVEAVGKINGVSINSIKTSNAFMISDGENTNLKELYSENLLKATSGKIDSYKIINVEENGNKYIASVEIFKSTVKKAYDIPGHKSDSRRSITVFNTSSNYREFGNILQQKIITDLLQSRKFNVLDRDSKGYYDMEKSLIKSDGVNSDEIYKLKNVLATDYILLFNVSGIDAAANGNKNKIEIVVDYRVLLFATRQIKFSNTLTMKVNLKDNSLIASEKVSEKIAKKISDDILNAIYPLKVAQVSNNEIIFSQTLTNDDIYECYSLGEVVKDSYTKENTARIETKNGMVKIIRSTPKLSYAQIIEGNVKKGDVCRPLDDSGVGMEKQHSVNQNGTVNLGW